MIQSLKTETFNSLLKFQNMSTILFWQRILILMDTHNGTTLEYIRYSLQTQKFHSTSSIWWNQTHCTIKAWSLACFQRSLMKRTEQDGIEMVMKSVTVKMVINLTQKTQFITHFDLHTIFDFQMTRFHLPTLYLMITLDLRSKYSSCLIMGLWPRLCESTIYVIH